MIALDQFVALGSGPGSPLGNSSACDISVEITPAAGYSAGLLNVRYQGTFQTGGQPFEGTSGEATFARRVRLSNGLGFKSGRVRTSTYSSAALIKKSDLASEFAGLGPVGGTQNIQVSIDLNSLGEGGTIRLTAIELEFAVFDPLGQLATE